MDRHIQEHTAGNLYIVRGWRLRVAGGDLDKLQFTDLLLIDQLAQTRKVVVKAAVEAHLQFDARLFDCFEHGLHLFGREVHGLFAKDVLPRLGRLDGNIRVRIRGGTDEHRVDLIVREHVVYGCINFFNAELLFELR